MTLKDLLFQTSLVLYGKYIVELRKQNKEGQGRDDCSGLGFVDGFDVGCMTKRGINNDSKVFSPRSW